MMSKPMRSYTHHQAIFDLSQKRPLDPLSYLVKITGSPTRSCLDGASNYNGNHC